MANRHKAFYKIKEWISNIGEIIAVILLWFAFSLCDFFKKNEEILSWVAPIISSIIATIVISKIYS